jgi:hypothetical protein
MALLSFLAETLSLAALYLVFVGQLSIAELLAAAAGAILAASCRRIIRRTAVQRFAAPRAPVASLCAAVAVRAAADSARLAGRFAGLLDAERRLSGRLAPQPFRKGGDAPREAARRALAIAFASLAPNAFVVDGARGGLLMHRLLPAGGSGDRDWLR